MNDLHTDLERLNTVVQDLQRENRELKGENPRLRMEVKKMADWLTPAICEFRVKFPSSEAHPI